MQFRLRPVENRRQEERRRELKEEVRVMDEPESPKRAKSEMRRVVRGTAASLGGDKRQKRSIQPLR